ncbi:MAG: NUDIX hydrolase [Xanthobacteraceae bacterium]
MKQPDPQRDHDDAFRGTYPNIRPRDAATLILIDRSETTPRVLVGRRHHGHVFMPNKIVFPGGRVDPTDHRVPVAAPIPAALEDLLMRGSPRIAAARARALATAAIREACEETGLCLGRPASQSLARLDGPWRPFADAGLLPDPSSLYLIARAITPSGRVRRFDTRFFTAEASRITHRVPGAVHADAELVELVWMPLGTEPLRDLHPMTRNVLGVLERRLAAGPLGHDHPVPLFHFRNGAMLTDYIGAG